MAHCPICDKPSDAKYAPFCSKRCADLDLSRWLKGGCAIPGRPVEEADETPSSEPRKSPKNGSSSGPD